MLRPWRKLGRDRLGDKTKQINIQNNQPQRQDTPQTGPDSAADMGLEYSWSHCPRGLSPPGQVLGNARSGGDATREKRRGKNLSLSELDCMSPESCSKVLIAAKLRLNNGCYCFPTTTPCIAVRTRTIVSHDTPTIESVTIAETVFKFFVHVSPVRSQKAYQWQGGRVFCLMSLRVSYPRRPRSPHVEQIRQITI